MGWHINKIVNTAEFTKEQAEILGASAHEYIAHVYEDDDGVKELFGYAGLKDVGNVLFFNPEHLEHMDYVTWNTKLCRTIADMGVEGDICFSSHEGDNAGQMWGVRFAGGQVFKLAGSAATAYKVV